MHAAAAGLVVRARAKINLALAVGERRSDGYHEIDSVMHSIELADRIDLQPGQGLQLHCDDPALPTGDDNLALAAARLLAPAPAGAAGVPGPHPGVGSDLPGVRILLRKHIPVAAGLGGGSADAAAVLRGLNAMWGCGLAAAALMERALLLGADVPFCVLGGAARVRGIGQSVTPIAGLAAPIVLIAFADGLPTARVYDEFDRLGAAGRPAAGRPAAAGSVVRALVAGDLGALAAALGNDLEPAAVRLRPEIARACEALLGEDALGAVMSGSGPTVFGLFDDAAAAREASARLRPNWPRVIQTALSPEGDA